MAHWTSAYSPLASSMPMPKATSSAQKCTQTLVVRMVSLRIRAWTLDRRASLPPLLRSAAGPSAGVKGESFERIGGDEYTSEGLDPVASHMSPCFDGEIGEVMCAAAAAAAAGVLPRAVPSTPPPWMRPPQKFKQYHTSLRSISSSEVRQATRTTVNCMTFRMMQIPFLTPISGKYVCPSIIHSQMRMQRNGMSVKKIDKVADRLRAKTMPCRRIN
mmetsp:Transcript_12676/g.37718  ORF Transcript_12676/g.37718 Transcript_12676/m.37718 type:complete len:216 (+) Transcript_12676:131-778(+)